MLSDASGTHQHDQSGLTYGQKVAGVGMGPHDERLDKVKSTCAYLIDSFDEWRKAVPSQERFYNCAIVECQALIVIATKAIVEERMEQP